MYWKPSAKAVVRIWVFDTSRLFALGYVGIAHRLKRSYLRDQRIAHLDARFVGKNYQLSKVGGPT
jgi:hypothetical protein